MVHNNELAIAIAENLLQINAIKLNPTNHFSWASGWKSPIYCDNRKVLSFPKIRNSFLAAFVDVAKKEYPETEVIAAVATAGIPMGALIAHELELPLVYVRSSAKDHGLQNKIEGVLEKGKKVLVIEDLVSTGGSSLNAVEALRDAGADVLGMMAIFTYGFDQAENNFAEKKCKLSTLSDYQHLIKVAVDKNIIDSSQLELLSSWRKNPETWGK